MIKGPYSPSPVYFNNGNRTSHSPLQHHQQHNPYYTPIDTYNHYSPHHQQQQQQQQQQQYPMTAIASAPRTLPPHIAVTKPSEPASPATIATTLSVHSTPSPSPQRVVIMPEQTASDYALFDEALLAASQELSQKSRESSNMSHTDYNNNTYTPIIAQQDHSSYNYNLYNNYSTATPMYDSNQPISTSSYDFNGVLPMSQRNQSHLKEEDVPALSPNTPHFPQTSRHSISSNGSFKSPVTPDRSSEDDKLHYIPMHIHTPIPKLGRTYSDAVQDELYNPNLIRPTEYPQKARKLNHQKSASASSMSTMMANFPGLFEEAQQQHQNDLSPQNMEHRDRSPFRANSPFHPVNSRFSYDPSQVMKQPIADIASQGMQKTISPKDAMLEYNEPEGEGPRINLFGPTRENSLEEPMLLSSQASSMDDYRSVDSSRRPSVASSVHVDIPLFNYAQPMYQNTNSGSYYHNVPDVHIPTYDDNRSSSFSDASDSYQQQQVIERPVDVKANSGTYTCTYSGCGHRFTTSAKLQKHRRESHRRSPATSGSVSTAAAIASRNAQPGPHRCMRPNANGKPCNSIFSRPYDLTRHEDTIHNSRKEKVRCELCVDGSKLFSRSDALVRHRRVKHLLVG